MSKIIKGIEKSPIPRIGGDLLETSLILCDAAQLAEGKFYILGGGWENCIYNIPQMALAVTIMVEWDQTNKKHKFELELQDEDGMPIMDGDPPHPLLIEGEFEAGRPPKHPPGMPIGVRQAINIQHPKLEPNKNYRWELRINGEPEARVSFYTR